MTSDLFLALLRFGAACIGSIACAAILGALLRRAALRWPALAAHRSVWLLAQGVVALVFVLACAPLPRGAVVPAVVLPPAALLPAPLASDDAAPAPAAGAAAAAIAAAATAVAATAPAPAPDLARDALRWLPAAWLAIYLAGLAWHAARRIRTQRRWLRVLRAHAHAIDAAALQASPAFTPRQRRDIARFRLAVRATGLAVSPMLLGVLRPGLLLPAHLALLDAGQQRLIVEHELTHWRRRDPLWLCLSGMLGLLFWFNRPLCRLDTALREAVELGCDDAVLAGRPACERQGYAAALVAQLRLQLQGQACPAPAFGSLGVAGRVQRMRAARPPRLGRRGRMLVGAGALGCAVLGAALQPAFSVAADVPAPLATIVAPAEPWRYPLDQVRVTTLYGTRSPSVPAGNHGVDFAAQRGTPVRAVAAGTVVEAAFNPVWGHYVRIDHGGGTSSLLIHLERARVAYGQRVAGGDVVGLSGASGRATGPHLHLEYWRDGRRLDPQTMLADLSARATPQALARRRAQGNPIPLDQ